MEIQDFPDTEGLQSQVGRQAIILANFPQKLHVNEKQLMGQCLNPPIFKTCYIVSAFPAGNILKCLPKELGLFTHLEELDIRDNNLTHLPLSVKSLTNLQVLHFSGMFSGVVFVFVFLVFDYFATFIHDLKVHLGDFGREHFQSIKY